MTDKELEQKLADAVSRAAPDDLEAILSRCGAQNGSVITMKPKQKKMVRWLAAACAALVLVGGGSGVYYHQSYAVTSVVSLDVNPSIELRVNRNEKVISCTALNEEAAAVLFSMGGGADLKGTKLDVAVNAIVGALVQAGYLDSVSSAILISVEDNNQDRAARLQQELVDTVDTALQGQASNASVLSQVLAVDAGAESLAASSGISAGKAALVQRLIDQNGIDSAAFDQLAALSVEELNDLLKTGETRIPIGKAAASVAAETYAGTLELSSVTTEVDPELDEYPAHYEVKLKVNSKKYEYAVDAFTGQILSGQKDVLVPAAQGGETQTPGVQTPDVQTPGVQVPDGQTPDSQAPNTQTPNTQTPNTQAPDTSTQPAGNGSSSTRTYIGEDAARDAALSHAGCSLSDTTYCKSWLSYDDGRPECYEVEFVVGTSEYEYEIGLYDGAVLKHECEVYSSHHDDSHHDDTHQSGTTAAVTTTDIGQEAAKQAALNHAGVSESQTSKLKVKQDKDDGRLEYEVEFKANGMEYEYTIDGSTGAVLEYESEWDD